MNLAAAAAATNARLLGEDRVFQRVSTDSRSVAAGDLFVALKGEHFDAHDFLAQAVQRGAAAALVEREPVPSAGASALPLLLVDDTRIALGRLAAHWRRNFTIPLVALTGSNGKTTVKEMLAAVMRQAVGSDDGVLATRGNLNNDIGLPLMLLELRGRHRCAVLEMGMSHPGEISHLTRLAQPTVALVTNAGPAHLRGLGTVEAVARAKGEIFEGLKPHGTAVINADDRYADLWRGLAADHRRVEFGLERPADVSAQFRPTDFGSELMLRLPGGQARVALQVPGTHNVRNALAAAAAAWALQVDAATIAHGLERFTGVAGRLTRLPCIHGATLIDDTYNANPASVRAAMEVLAAAGGRRILVLGDMGELGSDAEAMHREIGEQARGSGVELLLALGELSRHAAQAFGVGARHFERIEDLLAELENQLAPGVTVLVKGSRFMQMERVVKSFRADAMAALED